MGLDMYLYRQEFKTTPNVRWADRKDPPVGQYHMPVNLTKREFIYPHDLGDGLKMLEQLYHTEFGGTLSALYALLACSHGRGGGDLPIGIEYDYSGERVEQRETPGKASAEFVLGRWAGDNVVIVGDYTEPGDIDHEFPIHLAYHLCSEPARVADHIAWFREEGQRERHPGDADAMEAIGPFTDITPAVREYFATNCRVTYSGSGWLDRKQEGVV